MTVNGGATLAVEWLSRREGERPIVAQLFGVLETPARNALFRAAVAERRYFVEASTGGADGHRHAQVHYSCVEEAEPLVDLVQELGPSLAGPLGVHLDEVRRVERQLTVHHAGGFYRPHRDDQGEEASRRALTYVYYFHGRRRWRGGELAFSGEPGLVVEPTDNSLVVFAASLEHEVRPVVAETALAFEDGRFTLNGWLWR
ncbi:MAG: 2OG-Fe(II) oxygenase [Deltaproteobacteria bacterium]|nr:2OG-Fe(II) oxygenase [Deltaproteobacteria bacterium]